MVTVLGTSVEAATGVHNKIPEFRDDERTAKWFLERIGSREYLALIALISGEPVGYMLSYRRSTSEVYCWMAGVIPAARGKGVLGKMMAELERWAQTFGAARICITTRNSRREMLRFLVRNGFLFIQVEERDSPIENRIHLQKDIK